MKKIFCTLILGLVIAAGALAQETDAAETSGVSDSGSLRIEASVPLTFIGIGFDVRCAYEFPISESWSWNLGVETNFSAYIMGPNISILGFGSIWWKSVYVSYGLGLGINPGHNSAGFIPLDLRIGWQPGFTRFEKRGLSFKIEAGFYGMWTASSIKISRKEITGDDIKFLAPVGISIGAAYRF